MPLFAFISGYVAHNSNTAYCLKDFIIKRSLQILLPAFSWSVIAIITTIVINKPAHYMGVIKPNFLYYAWFLKCIWICSIITFICTKYLKRRLAFVALSCICLIFVCFQSLGNIFWVSFLLPVYMIGMFTNRLIIIIKKQNSCMLIFICAVLVYIITYITYWDTDLLIYSRPIAFLSDNFYLDLRNIFISSIRWILGISASVFLLLGINKITSLIPSQMQIYMSNIGKNTLGIYLIHIVLLDIIDYFNKSFLISNKDSFILIFSIFLTYITYIAVVTIQKSNHLGLILLGKIKRK